MICQDGSTPLHLACEKGHKEVALMLIEHGASAADKDEVRLKVSNCSCCYVCKISSCESAWIFLFLLYL